MYYGLFGWSSRLRRLNYQWFLHVIPLHFFLPAAADISALPLNSALAKTPTTAWGMPEFSATSQSKILTTATARSPSSALTTASRNSPPPLGRCPLMPSYNGNSLFNMKHYLVCMYDECLLCMNRCMYKACVLESEQLHNQRTKASSHQHAEIRQSCVWPLKVSCSSSLNFTSVRELD